jgi:hypothetical protein
MNKIDSPTVRYSVQFVVRRAGNPRAYCNQSKTNTCIKYMYNKFVIILSACFLMTTPSVKNDEVFLIGSLFRVLLGIVKIEKISRLHTSKR